MSSVLSSRNLKMFVGNGNTWFFILLQKPEIPSYNVETFLYFLTTY